MMTTATTDTDLPAGYRWATAAETERHAGMPRGLRGAIIVPRTVDSAGTPYTHGEADLAVPA